MSPKAALAAALLLGLVACHVPGETPPSLDPTDPASVARAFLSPRLDPDDAAALEPLVDRATRRGAPAALVDALRSLETVGSPRVELVEPLAGLDRAAVEVELPLAGGGTARVALDLVRDAGPPAAWRVAWFAGGGVEWPPPARGVGLTVSAAPDDL